MKPPFVDANDDFVIKLKNDTSDGNNEHQLDCCRPRYSNAFNDTPAHVLLFNAARNKSGDSCALASH